MTSTPSAPRLHRRARFVVALGLAAITLAGLTGSAATPRFYPDDPLAQEPDPGDASKVADFPTHLSWDLISSLFANEGDPVTRPAQDVNTVGEVPDSSWFVNRAGSRPLTVAEVGRGPDTTGGPAPGPWTVVSGKSEGVRPGFTIKDSADITWFLKFDPPGYPEQATSAEVVSTKLFWALGYRVAETHVAEVRRENLVLDPTAHITVNGRRRALTGGDITRVLVQAARNIDGSYRAIASRQLDGTPVGEFLYYGTRSDDPNDVVPHEHRRELRGMVAAAAWIDRVDAKAGNTLDTVVREGGHATVHHHVLDFGSTLGSAGIGGPNEYWEGNAYLFNGPDAARRLLLLGFPVPAWRHKQYPELRGIGRIEGDAFDPAAWKSRVPNAAYVRADAADLFWAATKIMAISDEMIAAAVQSGHYTDATAARYLTDTLIKRRDAIGRAFLPAVNPVTEAGLDDGGTLRFTNAAVAHGFAAAPPAYTTTWALFDNATGHTQPIGRREGPASGIAAPGPLPSTPGAFLQVDVSAADAAHPAWARPLHLHFRRDPAGWTLVGLERQSGLERGSRADFAPTARAGA